MECKLSSLQKSLIAIFQLILQCYLQNDTKKIQTFAHDLKNLLIKQIKDFQNIEIAGSGFLNITLKEKSLLKIIEQILKIRISLVH